MRKQSSAKSLWVTGIVSSVFFVLIVGGALWICTVQEIDTLEQTGRLADTIGPILGIWVAFVTFMAFYIQFQANQETKEQFRIQHQNSLEAGFETSFFARLELFKKVQDDVAEVVKFKDIIGEYELIHRIILDGLKRAYNRSGPRHTFGPMGIVTKYPNWESLIESHWPSLGLHQYVFNILNNGIVANQTIPNRKPENARFIHNTFYLYIFPQFSRSLPPFDVNEFEAEIKKIPMFAQGCSHLTNHYFRNLYHLYKFVIDTTAFNDMSISVDLGKFKSLEEKRINMIKSKKLEYIRLIRAQMSNFETVLLYYNVISDMGQKWCVPKTVNEIKRSMVRDFEIFKNLNLDLILPQYLINELPYVLGQYFPESQGGKFGYVKVKEVVNLKKSFWWRFVEILRKAIP